MDKSKPLPCKCGAKARVRHKDPYVWIECGKKCGIKTGSYLVFIREISEQDAIKKWNSIVNN